MVETLTVVPLSFVVVYVVTVRRPERRILVEVDLDFDLTDLPDFVDLLL